MLYLKITQGAFLGFCDLTARGPNKAGKEHWTPGQAHLHYSLCRRPHSPWGEPSNIKGVCLPFRVSDSSTLSPDYHSASEPRTCVISMNADSSSTWEGQSSDHPEWWCMDFTRDPEPRELNWSESSHRCLYIQILVPHSWNVYPKPQFFLHIRIHMCLDMDADCTWVYTHLHSYIDAHSTYTETHTDPHTNTQVHGHIYVSSHTQIGLMSL